VSAGWLAALKRCDRPRLRLICFPFGGGGATAFYQWQAALPPGVELWAVALPGREHRSDEPPATDAEAAVAALCAALEPLHDAPLAFYGHSLGAGLALQTAHELRARGRPQPARFIASGRLPPHHPCERWSERSDDELLGHLTVLGGIPPALLRNASFLELYLPRIRADFALNESLRYARVPAFGFPLTIVNGRTDPLVKEAALEEWRDYTTATCELRWLPGDHFFMQSEPAPFFDLLARELAAGGSAEDRTRRIAPGAI
jgi:surfactin synthase thioesterase subunit